MADLERKVEKLDERVTSLEIQFSALMAKVDKTIDEIHDIRQEMRDRDNQRAEDIREIRHGQTRPQFIINGNGSYWHNGRHCNYFPTQKLMGDDSND